MTKRNTDDDKGAAADNAPTKSLKKGEVVLMNVGVRDYETVAGTLRPGKSITLPKEEADKLLGYHDIKDASDISPALGKTVDELREQLENATSQVTNLTEQLAEKDGKIAALTTELDEAKKLIEETR